MKEILNKIISKLKFIYSFIKSYLFGVLNKRKYKGIDTFVMFIGYPRSGHSLIAALLDAHPNIVMGMEWGVLSHIKMGYNKYQIFYSLVRNSRSFNRRKKNVWTDYSYQVSEMWQGKFKNINVIGDKLGGRTSIMIMDNPELLNQLERVMNKSIKLIHVIRNPFDTITTMAKRSFEKKGTTADLNSMDLSPFIKSYFDRVKTISSLKLDKRIGIYDLYHEDFINRSGEILKDLLFYLGVKDHKDYIEKCSEILYDTPHKSRLLVKWPDELIHFVQKNINKYEFLRRYSYYS
jgi:hypothetical protein